MKKITAIALCLALGISTPVFADVVNDLKAAEEVFGIDNSDKTAIERVGILEEQLGITDAEGTLSDRLGRIENELGMRRSGNRKRNRKCRRDRSDGGESCQCACR